MTPFDLRPEMLAGAWLLAMFASSVALDIATRVRGLERGTAFGWWLGGSLSVGTGFWATDVMALLSARGPGPVGHEPVYVLLSWLLAVAAVGAALRLASLPLRSTTQMVWGGVATGTLLCAMHAASVGAMGFEPPLKWQPGLVALAGMMTLMTSALFVAGLSAGHNFGPARSRAWQLASVAVLSTAMVSQIYFAILAGRFAEGAVSTASAHLAGDALGVLAGTAAAIALTMTRLMAALERRLTGRTEQLAASLRQANDDLQKIAYRDPLTELPNRLVFEQRLSESVARADREGTRLALLFIDLDGFKPINDSYGHSAGDAILRAVGERLRGLSRQGDTMARVGGDEFLMLLEGAPDEGSAALVAARVLDTLGAPVTVGEKEVAVSCSIGVVFYPDGGAQSKLIAHADAAMYSAKRAGGSTYCFFEPRMEADAREQVDLLRDLRQAIENHELELYFQPKIDAKSGQVTAAEALLRWHHPVRGLVLPSVFIPVAERFGLIGMLGSWVIEDACRQVRAWHDAGLAMRVAINLSAHQMRQDDLVERIQMSLRRHRIDPSLITCEITETVAMEDTKATQAAFQRLGKAGLHLSIDDFGTGYSSLSYLRQLPAEELKIDRAFIMDLDKSEDARAIVDAVVRLAHALSLKVVAEGVDTPRQCEILLELGCDELQGFLFAKPMSAKALLEWAAEDTAETAEFRPSLFVEPAPSTVH
jgi:diguanylate cyclase (GGDEF)-like protein